MARLIDADVLIGKLSSMVDYCRKDSKVNGLAALFEVGDAIMDCKTVDAVEVVRCKDCKYWEPSGTMGGDSVDDMQTLGGCEYVRYCRREKDFCSYGERK